MKKYLLILALFPVAVMAQLDMSQGDIMKMMEQAQKAQTCMQDVDMSALEGLEAEGKQKQAEIKTLCADGQRDEAQTKAMGYAKEMMDRPEMQAMKQCGELLRGVIPDMPFDHFEEKYKDSHVCDDI